METAVHMPIVSRINFRVVLFAAVVLLVVGSPVYLFVKASINKGIEDYGSYKKVDLKALGFFAFDEFRGTLNDVPAYYRELDGQRVMLEGYMAQPTNDAAEYITQFQFVYNVQKCCFGGPPKVQERVFANVPAGAKVRYYGGPARLVGKLHVKPHKTDTRIDELYTLDVESVQPM